MYTDHKRSIPLILLTGTTAIAVAVGLVLSLTSPPDAFQGDFARIFHVHVPSAWIAFLAFGFTAVGSLGWLIRKHHICDLFAASSAQIGVVFTGAAIISGSLWGKTVWGTYWDWSDKRLTTTALMFFVYLGYLAIRHATDDPLQRANRSAFVGIVGALQLPLVYFSVRLWRTLHPGTTITPGNIDMDSEMLRAFLANLFAFTLVFITLLVFQIRLETARHESIQTETLPAGAGIEPPRLGQE